MEKKEQTIVEELANAPREGEQAFAEKEKETPSAPPTEQTKKEDPKIEPPKAESENIPFHKHPRWIERERQQKKQIEDLQSQFKTEIEALRKSIPPQPQTVPQMPQWFVNIYGDNFDAWKEYSAYTAEERKQIKEELRKELLEETRKEAQETKEIEKSLDKAFAELKDSGRELDENAFTKLILDFESKGAKLPLKSDSSFDLEAIYDLFDSMGILPKNTISSTATAAKKELAAATIKRTPEASKKEFSTPKDFKGKSWRDLIK